MKDIIPIERIESKFYLVRGQKVMFDFDLAELYGIETKHLKRQVRRNQPRFPEDFAFQLTKQESLRCQIVTSKSARRGGRRYLPYAFTEHGILMLSSVLNSEKAIQVNIAIMRAFVRLKKVLAANHDLSYLFKELKHKVDQHDVEIGLIIKSIEEMIAIEQKPKPRIGFVTKSRD